MHTFTRSMIAPVFAAALLATLTAPAPADDFKADPAHTSVVFKVLHMKTSHTFGRFNQVEGTLSTGDKPAFEFTVQAASVDTGIEKRDNHLRNPDFFNAVQFPTITFKSTAVTATDDGYDVTGDLTLHGKTNAVTVHLTKVGESDSKMGHRIGFDTTFTIKRSDYGMDKLLDAVGDEVTLMVGIEATK